MLMGAVPSSPNSAPSSRCLTWVGSLGAPMVATALAEWYDPTDGHIGLQRALLLVLAYDDLSGG